MKRATPKMRVFAKAIIDHELNGGSTSGNQHPEAAIVWEKLRPQLSTLMGAGGFRALMGRARALADAEAPWLRNANRQAGDPLTGFEELDPGLGADKLAEGRVILLAQLLGLLVAFIGEKLTVRMVREVWPKISLKGLGLDDGSGA